MTDSARPREEDQAPEERPRLPYVKPVLRRLGGVRELTLGASAGFVEGAGTFIMPM